MKVLDAQFDGLAEAVAVLEECQREPRDRKRTDRARANLGLVGGCGHVAASAGLREVKLDVNCSPTACDLQP